MKLVAKKLAPISEWPIVPQRHTCTFKECDALGVDSIGVTGAGICTIKRMNFPTPAGFIIRTEAYKKFNAVEQVVPTLPTGLLLECKHHVRVMEEETNMSFEYKKMNHPLLLSVRCGTSEITPNLNYSVLNVGMNDDVCQQLEDWSGNKWFALNTYANFLYSFGVHVLHIPVSTYLKIVDEFSEVGIDEFNFCTEALLVIVSRMKAVTEIPEDAWQQLCLVVLSMFVNWKTRCPRGSSLCPAITIQEMIYGNFNNNSGSGVLFSRDPITGNEGVYGEYIYQMAGTGISSGIEMSNSVEALRWNHPDVYELLSAVVLLLELETREMQRMEFVVQDGKYYILATQKATRSSLANMKILVAMVQEKLITREVALLRIDAAHMSNNLFCTVDPSTIDIYPIFGFGNAVSAGIISGVLCFSPGSMKLLPTDQNIIAVCQNMDFQSFADIACSDGIITLHGGAGSHGSMLARQMSIPCVSGVSQSGVRIGPEGNLLNNSVDMSLASGACVTIDGTTGRIYVGEAPGVGVDPSQAYAVVMEWAEAAKSMNVFSTADSPVAVKHAVTRGPDGGVFKFDTAFFQLQSVLDPLRLLLMSNNTADALAHGNQLSEVVSQHLIPVFLFRRCKPLYISLPAGSVCSLLAMDSVEFFDFATRNGFSALDLKRAFNIIVTYADLSTCGGKKDYSFLSDVKDNDQQRKTCNELELCSVCRSFLSHPKVVAAFINGAVDAHQIIRPKLSDAVSTINLLVSDTFREEEIDSITNDIATADLLQTDCAFSVGLNVQTPRSCLNLGRLASRHGVGSVLFNTDRLTELSFGITAHPAGFMRKLSCRRVTRPQKQDPFVSIDEVGVGYLIETGIKGCKGVNSACTVLVQGGHCTDPSSVHYFCSIGVDCIVVTNTFAVDGAVVACAQFEIKNNQNSNGTDPQNGESV